MIRRESLPSISREWELRAKILKDSAQYLTYMSDCKSKYPDTLVPDYAPVEYEKDELVRRAHLAAIDALYIDHAAAWLKSEVSGKPFTVTFAKSSPFGELSAWVRTMEKVVLLAVESSLCSTIEKHLNYICGYQEGIKEIEERIQELSLKPGNDVLIQKKRGQLEEMRNELTIHESDLKIVSTIWKDPQSLIEYTESHSRIGRGQGSSLNFESGASGSARERGTSEDTRSESKLTLPEPIVESRAL